MEIHICEPEVFNIKLIQHLKAILVSYFLFFLFGKNFDTECVAHATC